MSVNMVTARPRVSVRRADDPFKKFWWMIVAGFGLIGLWLFMPSGGPGVGSTRVDPSSVAQQGSGADQSLDAVGNPGGAPGGAIDQTQAGAERKAAEQKEAASFLYQAPEQTGAMGAGATAAGAPIGSASGSLGKVSGSLAQQLKDAGTKDASGWGGEKAQSGFVAPHVSGNLAGTAAAHGGSSASSPGTGAFGTKNAVANLTAAGGFGDAGIGKQSGNAGLQALREAAGPPGGPGANGAKGGPKAVDLGEAVGGNSHAFDGALTHGGIAPEGGGKGTLAALNAAAAPMDLKGVVNPADLTKKHFPTPPHISSGTAGGSNDLMKQLQSDMLPILLQGMVPGVGGALLAVVAKDVMAQQKQKADAANARSEQSQQQASGGSQ